MNVYHVLFDGEEEINQKCLRKTHLSVPVPLT